VSKFRQATLSNSEVIGAHLLHFKPLYDAPLKNVVRRALVNVGDALVRLRHSLARVKILVRTTP